MLVVLGGEPRRLAEVRRPRVLDCNSAGHLYKLRPRSLKSAFPGGWRKKKKITHKGWDCPGAKEEKGKWRGEGQREEVRSLEETINEILVADVRVLCPITTRGRASSSTRSQTLPSWPRAANVSYSMPQHVPWAQLCPTLCDPMDCKLEWVAISFSRRSSPPWDQTCVSCVSCIAGRFLTRWAIGESCSWEPNNALLSPRNATVCQAARLRSVVRACWLLWCWVRALCEQASNSSRSLQENRDQNDN